MINKCNLSVILPSYLEEENLNILLPRLNAALSELENFYEIIVVDTLTSLDHTQQICHKNNVIYINRENGNTFGDAVRTGIKYATGKWIIFMDADGSHQPEFIADLFKHKDSQDIIVASRYVPGGCTENPLSLILMSKILNKIYGWVLGISCQDISNSFKLYKGDQLRSIKLKCNNFDIIEEILIRLTQKYPGIKIKEVPFVFRKRMFGQTKRNLLLFMLTYIVSLVRLKLVALNND